MSDAPAPLFMWLERVTAKSAVVVFPETVFLVMRERYMGSKDRGYLHDRTLRRISHSYGDPFKPDRKPRVYCVGVKRRDSETVARFLSSVAYQIGTLQRTIDPIEERHRFDLDRDLKKTRDWLERFARGMDLPSLLASLDSK